MGGLRTMSTLCYIKLIVDFCCDLIACSLSLLCRGIPQHPYELRGERRMLLVGYVLFSSSSESVKTKFLLFKNPSNFFTFLTSFTIAFPMVQSQVVVVGGVVGYRKGVGVSLLLMEYRWRWEGC
ncbi:hypothetical protein Tco_1525445 [Tanacetum coccineum]